MEIKWKSNPNYRSSLSTKEIMKQLTIALAVVYVFGLVRSFAKGTRYGINVIVMMIVALVCALGTEAIWAKVQKQDVKKYLSNSFGWVTAMIIVLCCRNTITPYAIGVATIIAIFFGKLVYGGFGQNVFNPAGVGRAIIGTSFSTAVITDAVSGATPTATLASAGWLMKTNAFNTYLSDFGGLTNFWIGWYDGAIGETSALLLIVVAIYLAYKKVIDWRITVTYVGTIFLGTTIMGLVNGVGMAYPLAFVSTGGIFFAAVFMLTDPVTCPNTRSGKIIFAAFAALMTVLIRLFANLPEGVVFSILLANIMTPVIEKVLLGKQVDMEKKLNLWVSVFVIAVIVIIALCATGLTLHNSYASVMALGGQ